MALTNGSAYLDGNYGEISNWGLLSAFCKGEVEEHITLHGWTIVRFELGAGTNDFHSLVALDSGKHSHFCYSIWVWFYIMPNMMSFFFSKNGRKLNIWCLKRVIDTVIELFALVWFSQKFILFSTLISYFDLWTDRTELLTKLVDCDTRYCSWPFGIVETAYTGIF